ncbi:alpha/beta hydrolase [Kibdelosporangium philippinense]|uniref:Alpha/beta hydrolase n=1 Tax=Kibdelosporangium philippinense TaxID=211113 RepID=A0ABS8Z842_9PSEU|nr:alpha/beta hydrolase [Kibdelosporangium philippinense]MCE7004054.1 alpha/beta hydrolase [Kibdelosporangium philippinense]
MTEALSYDVHGSGPGLVLIHGPGGFASTTWGSMVEQLAAYSTVVLPDLPGSGDSTRAGEPLEVATLADQIVATAHAAGLSEFVIGGVSTGAAIAIAVAARWPARVHGVISICGYAYPRATLRLNLEIWRAMLDSQDGVTRSRFLTSLLFAEPYLAALPPDAVNQLVKQLAGLAAPGTTEQVDFALAVDVRPDLAAVRAPALVVVPPVDRFVAPEHAAEIANGITEARLVEVPGGHASFFEDPQPTLDAMITFLRELP